MDMVQQFLIMQTETLSDHLTWSTRAVSWAWTPCRKLFGYFLGKSVILNMGILVFAHVSWEYCCQLFGHIQEELGSIQPVNNPNTVDWRFLSSCKLSASKTWTTLCIDFVELQWNVLHIFSFSSIMFLMNFSTPYIKKPLPTVPMSLVQVRHYLLDLALVDVVG